MGSILLIESSRIILGRWRLRLVMAVCRIMLVGDMFSGGYLEEGRGMPGRSWKFLSGPSSPPSCPSWSIIWYAFLVPFSFSADNLTVASQGDVFPELTKKVDEIKEILDEEEESFSRTLDRGERLFDQYASKAKQQGAKELSGRDVWRLYDTYGFPVDLTRLMAEEIGLGINEEEFAKAQALSKEASKASLKKTSSDAVKLDVHSLAALEKNKDVPKTDDSAKFRE